ncbi:hypothetical protein [Pseudomonas oryzihabitans]|uniref:hypothetical protein n=1 Tax=Pseudomonas oryzihabitans TaxID=47885 RepID=UPI002894EF0D|nr:hypothetical protein [Pseudomonas oryzihabitans]MDT3718268.1 hypothetical protein [Pseudomonas oryzihabitans]
MHSILNEYPRKLRPTTSDCSPKEELALRLAIKRIGLIVMLLGIAALFIGWFIDPTLSLNDGVRLISIQQELLQTDLFLWGTILFGLGLNGYLLHTDL